MAIVSRTKCSLCFLKILDWYQLMKLQSPAINFFWSSTVAKHLLLRSVFRFWWPVVVRCRTHIHFWLNTEISYLFTTPNSLTSDLCYSSAYTDECFFGVEMTLMEEHIWQWQDQMCELATSKTKPRFQIPKVTRNNPSVINFSHDLWPMELLERFTDFEISSTMALHQHRNIIFEEFWEPIWRCSSSIYRVSNHFIQPYLASRYYRHLTWSTHFI